MTSHLSCPDRLHKLTVLSVSGSVAAAAGEQTHGSGGRKLWSSPRFTAAFGSALWPSHIPLSWQTHTPLSLSLSLFISAGSRTVALHSTLINNLYRKTTKRVNWQTPHALTVRLSFSCVFFFSISFFFTLACFSINDSRVILITARDWLNLNRTEDASVNCQSQRRSRLYMYRTRRTEGNWGLVWDHQEGSGFDISG